MREKTLLSGALVAAGIFAIIICVGMVTGYPVTQPVTSVDNVSNANTAALPGGTGTAPPGAAQYIRVDPVADKTTGDLLIVSGSTNFPAGTDLIIQAAGTNSGSKVREGTGGVNVWSGPIDTSVSKPGSYQITVTNMVGSVENGDYGIGTVNGTTPFTLKGTYLTTETPVRATVTKDDFIRVDAIGDRNVGDQFLVTGTTSLPVGTEVLWEVIPVSLTTNPNQSGTFSGTMANSQVTKGTGTANRVTFTLDTYVLQPERYNVSVSTVAGNLSEGDFRTGDPKGSVQFTLKPGPASADSGPYIRIDPVDAKTTGDLLIVTGSTNFPAGTILMVQIGSPGIGSGGDTIVRTGTGGANRYSMPADTSFLKPGTQTITVTNMKGDPAKGDYGLGDVNSTATFTLSGTYRGTDAPVQAIVTKDDYIRLDAIGDRTAGDQFLLTGKTSLPVGAGLIWQIQPDTGTTPSGLDMNAKGIMANAPVTKGTSASNRVTLAVDTGGLVPGKYVVAVGIVTGDMSTGAIGMGEPIGIARFTLN